MRNVSRSLDNSQSELPDAISSLIEQRMLELLAPENPASRFSHLETEHSNVVEAAVYHLSTGGRRMRVQLCIHAGLAVGLSTENIVCLGAACELIHNASLIHDDIQDRDEYRRGKKTVWAVYGQSIAICAGDLYLSAAYLSLARFERPELVGKLIQKIHERIAHVIQGQCADLALKDKLLNDIELYEQVVIAKSGALIGLPLELCLISAQMSEWLPKTAAVVEPFSIGYQILDDLNDLKEDVASDSKQRSLNAILVLEQLQGSDDPIKTARQLAREKFQQAAMSAKMLPKNVGHQFAELALYMADQV